MAGPTIESLDVEYKELRADFHRLEVAVANLERSVKASIARVEIVLVKQEAVLGVFRAIVLGSLGAAITCILTTVWSAGATSSKVNALQSQVDRIESRLDRIELGLNRLVSLSATLEAVDVGK